MRKRRKQGWHPEIIRAELKMRGHSFSKIGQKRGYADPYAPSKVLRQRWPMMEQVVADLLGVHPSEIWPDRYRLDGSPAARGPRGPYRKTAKPEIGKAQGAA